MRQLLLKDKERYEYFKATASTISKIDTIWSAINDIMRQLLMKDKNI